jgi:hypothetical protein
VATVQQAAEDVGALGPGTGEGGEEAKRASVIALQRQMRKAVSFAAALKVKRIHTTISLTHQSRATITELKTLTAPTRFQSTYLNIHNYLPWP